MKFTVEGENPVQMHHLSAVEPWIPSHVVLSSRPPCQQSKLQSRMSSQRAELDANRSLPMIGRISVSLTEFACAAAKGKGGGGDGAVHQAQVAKAVKKLGQRKVGNSFVELRKLALHPLLTRRIFGDDRVLAMAKLSRRRYSMAFWQLMPSVVVWQLQYRLDIEKRNALSDTYLHSKLQRSIHSRRSRCLALSVATSTLTCREPISTAVQRIAACLEDGHLPPCTCKQLKNGTLCRGLFGGASEDKIQRELLSYSDFQLHSLALENGTAFKDYLLGQDHLYASAKCRYLAKLLPELKVQHHFEPPGLNQYRGHHGCQHECTSQCIHPVERSS